MFKRLGNLIRGFFGIFISDLEKKNPEALIEVERENLRKQIGEFNKGLAAHAGLCEKIMSQVKRLEREEEDLKSKVTGLIRTGNREHAGQAALQLKKVRENLAENRAQLEDAEKTYEELLRSRDVAVKAAKEKIEELKRDISDMKVQQAVAELNEMAAGMVTEIGGSGDTLNRVHEMVKEERDKAKGRSRVAKDSGNLSEIEAMEQEQKAMEEMALADFAAEEGIALDEEEKAEGSTGDSKSDSGEEETGKTM